MRTTALMITLFIISTQHLFAESMPTLATDSRIRITAPTLMSNPLIGNIAGIHPDALILAPRIRIPINAISQIDISLGQKTVRQSTQSSAWKGALAIGGFVAATAAETCRRDRSDCKGGRIFLAVAGGTVTGGLFGGIYGALHRPERWTTVSPTQLNRFPPPGNDSPQ